MKKLKIDKNVPIPNHIKRKIDEPYDWDNIEIGDSFFIGCKDDEFVKRDIRSKLGQSHKRWCQRKGIGHLDRLVTRSVEGGIRTWRVK